MYYFYCKCCGKIHDSMQYMCDKCGAIETHTICNHELDYYKSLSKKQYGDHKHWYEFLIPEIKANIEFDEQKFNRIDPNEAYKSTYKIPTYFVADNTQHIPHCPICGSTNIEKISTIRKAASQIMFGIFSSTIGKTFVCKNCGAKF